MRQLLSDYELRSARVLALVTELRPGTIDRDLARYLTRPRALTCGGYRCR